jgi:glucosamine-6-phosphate deaminase
MGNSLAEQREVDLLAVEIVEDRATLGKTAAVTIAESIRTLLATRETARIIFAAAPSQGETLAELAQLSGIDWQRVDAFHMDEYVGIARDAPQRFSNWLGAAFFDLVPLRSVHLIDPESASAADESGEAARYSSLLAQAPIDIVLSGIGVSGHMAFNDPPADFSEADTVKVITLSPESRRQQVDEGLFGELSQVPTRAWTLTMPLLLSATEIFCMVPGSLKREAVRSALTGEIRSDSPASALRGHPRARLFLDRDSSPFSGPGPLNEE